MRAVSSAGVNVLLDVRGAQPFARSGNIPRSEAVLSEQDGCFQRRSDNRATACATVCVTACIRGRGRFSLSGSSGDSFIRTFAHPRQYRADFDGLSDLETEAQHISVLLRLYGERSFVGFDVGDRISLAHERPRRDEQMGKADEVVVVVDSGSMNWNWHAKERLRD